MPATSDGAHRILLIRTDRLGDVVLTLPMLPLLRSCYPDAFIAMLLKRYTGEIVRGNPYVNEMLWYDASGYPVPFWTMVKMLRSKHFDTAIVVHPTLRLAGLVFLSGIPIRIGSGYRYYSLLFNRRVFEHRKDARRHEVEYNINMLKELNCPVETSPEFCIKIAPEDGLAVENLLAEVHCKPGERLVIIHPGSGGSAREWPAESFAAFASGLLDRCRVKVLITGVRGDEGKSRLILEATHNSAVDMTGRLTLKQLAALIRSSSLFISNSTGPLHIAAAVGTPVIGLYPQLTPMSAARWGPYTGTNRVYVPNKPIDCRACDPKRGGFCACMASIPVEDVVESAAHLLSQTTPVRSEVPAREQ